MSRFRRIKLQHIRQVNEECHSKEKEVAYKKWQANQIQIWKGMNALALMEEAEIKKLSELLDKTDQSQYNILIMINWLKHKFLGEQMATANYTEAMTDKMVAQYEANPTRETVEALAKELGKNTRSVIAKLSREGVYQAQPRTTKTGEPIVRKAELLAQIESTLGVEFPSLVKATKADLQRLIDTISD